jgi:hypothetical protein
MPQLLTINLLTFACILASTTDLYLSLPVIMTEVSADCLYGFERFILQSDRRLTKVSG